MHVIGDVEGKAAIIVDDIISTGTSAAEAVHTLKRHGARDVYLCATHPVFSPGAVEKLRASGLKEIIVSNTIPADAGGLENLRVLSVANLLGEAIRRIHKSESVSSLFV
jgi:ribose-phosphate pyrophosphokinase